MIEYPPADTDPWSISAVAASAPKDGSELELRGNVTLRNQPGRRPEPIVIATETLRFFPDSSSAETDTPVSLRSASWQVQAGPLRTHLKGDVVQLESESTWEICSVILPFAAVSSLMVCTVLAAQEERGRQMPRARREIVRSTSKRT